MVAVSMEDDLHVAGHWLDAEKALESLENTKIHVALVDYRLPGINGIQFSRLLLERSPQVKVLIISGLTDLQIIYEAFEAGASGFIQKDTSLPELIDAIRSVRRGERVLKEKLLRKCFDFSLNRQPSQTHAISLTTEQRESLAMAGAGMSNKEIAEKMELSEPKVKLRLRGAMQALKARNCIHAVSKALVRGIIEVEQ